MRKEVLLQYGDCVSAVLWITHIQEQLTPMGTHAEGWSGAWKAYFTNDD